MKLPYFSGITLLSLLFLGCLVVHVGSQPVSSDKDGKQQDSGKDNQTVKHSDAIISPTNVFRNNDLPMNHHVNGQSQNAQRDLRPFQWLYNHLGQYLKCAYQGHSNCEERLAKDLRKEENDGSNAPNKYPNMFQDGLLNARSQQPFDQDRRMNDFNHQFPVRTFDHFPQNRFTGHARPWEGPRRNENFNERPFEYENRRNEFMPPHILRQPFGPKEEQPYQPEAPHRPQSWDFMRRPEPFRQMESPIDSSQPLSSPQRQLEQSYTEPEQFNGPPMMMFPPDFFPFFGGETHLKDQPAELLRGEQNNNEDSKTSDKRSADQKGQKRNKKGSAPPFQMPNPFNSLRFF